MEGRTDGGTDGRTDGRTEGRCLIFPVLSLYQDDRQARSPKMDNFSFELAPCKNNHFIKEEEISKNPIELRDARTHHSRQSKSVKSRRCEGVGGKVGGGGGGGRGG